MNRPQNMSRRGFLRAIGVTTLTASGLFLVEPRRVYLARWQDDASFLAFEGWNPEDVGSFIKGALKHMGPPAFVDVSADLRHLEGVVIPAKVNGPHVMCFGTNLGPRQR